MIRIMARIYAQPDAAPQLRDILTELVAPSRAEAGCLSYELFQDEESPQDFITVERWTDVQAVEAHMASPHVARAIAGAATLLSQPPLIHRFTQLA